MRRLPLRSPPRMRGKGPVRRRDGAGMGITPAYAGKRTCTATRRCGNGDHPRVCGEKIEKQGDGYAVLGSPPRMRGKVPEQSSYSQAWGITPACAGKRVLSPRLFQGDRDHPRVCGEKDLYGDATVREWGSPPRMRGKGNLYLLDGVLDGITPAYAGKSAATPNVEAFYEGSPPRMRGKD